MRGRSCWNIAKCVYEISRRWNQLSHDEILSISPYLSLSLWFPLSSNTSREAPISDHPSQDHHHRFIFLPFFQTPWLPEKMMFKFSLSFFNKKSEQEEIMDKGRRRNGKVKNQGERNIVTVDTKPSHHVIKTWCVCLQKHKWWLWSNKEKKKPKGTGN